ncbi:kanadaptin [Impatiens glandulifera]|uniref:kanadaptin n=1 Tax=Impatiens glandulifera TaxID=253017 RepID=UPI001FB152A8|nr:kanadaptin [Impatiens glandulifera]
MMASNMGPPPSPPRNETQMNSETSLLSEPENETPEQCLTSELMKVSMRPPPPKNPKQSQDNSSLPLSTDTLEAQQNHLPNETEVTKDPIRPAADQSSAPIKHQQRQNITVPYEIPPWSEPPCHRYFLEVLKEGSIIDQLHVYDKGAYMFGRVDLCDFMLEHPTISRFHAVLQFKQSGDASIYDLGSTHGTFVNKKQVKKNVYEDLHVGDVIRFGQSTRLYIFQGPSELMRPEGDLKSIRKARMRDEVRDMEASVLRAKKEASLADGISWGMGEDAIEEAEEEIEEITWQTFKGQLTEKQVKTRDKLLKRLEKVANMKKEINAIRAKDISQGGLTQGQQTQIARNEQRMLQITEELENLEETLNESIRESLGARSGKKKTHGNKTGAEEDDEDTYMSDEDDFYDRTKKRSAKKKGEEGQSIETADSLLDKKDILLKDMEEKNKLILEEQNRTPSGNDVTDAGDELDAYMSGLSSQLVLDKTDKLQKELSALQSELDRIQYLLNIADPAGEASKRRESASQESKTTISAILKHTPLKKPEKKKKPESETPTQEQTIVAEPESSKKPEEDKAASDVQQSTKIPYTVTKPQWLGAVGDMNEKEQPQREQVPVESQESDQFVDYKDRKLVLENPIVERTNDSKPEVEGIEDAAPGLIIRKKRKKEIEQSTTTISSSSPKKDEISAENAVALLLKHKRGYQSMDDEGGIDTSGEISSEKDDNNNKKSKRVLGPEKPQFLEPKVDYETWVPPEGQSGDGRTSLNDRYGY